VAKVVRLQTGARQKAGSSARAIPREAKACVAAPAAAPVAGALRTGPVPGERFASMRRQHAVEMFGACMMIATFLVLALFG
jgi:hypothetical protein